MKSKHSTIPFVIGVIGHLDVVVDEALIKDIKDKLSDIIERLSDDVPIILQSQLAVGADTLIALIFLDLRDKYPNKYLKLHVPLPMSFNEYIKDFKGEDLDTFYYIHSQADEVFELPTHFSTQRNDWYNQGANFITDSSMLVLILWDGHFNHKIGGTSESVKRIYFGPSHDTGVSDNDNKAVIWHVKRKSSNELDKTENIIIDKYAYDSIIQHPDNLNVIKFINNTSKLANKIASDNIDQSASYLSKDNFGDSLEKISFIRLINFYSLSDAISIREQKKYLIISKLTFILSFFAMILFQFYEKLPVSAVFYVIFPCTVIALMVYLKKFNISIGNNASFLRHRLIAESLRINFYLSSAGLPVINHRNSAVIHHDDWINRISNSLANISIRKNPVRIDNAYNVITKNWLTDQHQYFEKKVEQLSLKISIFSKLINAIFFLVFIIFIAALIGVWTHYPHVDVLINIDFTLFILFLISKTYYDFREYENTQLQSQIMSKIYHKHINYLAIDSSEERSDVILTHLADKALTELNLWYLIYKSKQPGIEV